MAQQQQYYQPQKQSGSQRRRDEEEQQELHDHELPTEVNERSSQVSHDADHTVGNIDDVLNDHQGATNPDAQHDTFTDRNENFKDHHDAPKDKSLASQESKPQSAGAQGESQESSALSKSAAGGALGAGAAGSMNFTGGAGAKLGLGA